MSTQTIDAPRRQADPLHGMSHVASTCCPPFTRTLCGIEIPAVDDVIPDGESVDCVVCDQLEREGGQCDNCGMRFVPR